MKELIPIRNENGELLVSARDLHERLVLDDGKEERFSQWFKRYLKDGFEENIDYVVCKKIYAANQYGGEKELEDFALKIDMAKEICMIQRTEKGREYRKYFIECERRLRELSLAPSLPDDILNRIIKLEDDAEFIRNQVHIKKLDSTVYIRTIKNFLGISTISENKAEYEFIRDMFFIRMGVCKFEDIPVTAENLTILKECCGNSFEPYLQIKLFNSL